MKSKITNVSVITVLSLAVLVALSTTLAAPPVITVSGSGETDLNFDNGHASGNGTLSIQGEELVASIEVQLLGPPVAGDDGTLHADVMHIFDLGDGNTFTTNDKAVLDPIEGGYNMNERMTIISGTGDFANVAGYLTVHGQIIITAYPLADVTFDVRGVISGY